ncbi:uncharacterized protein LOC129798260 [Phlebotomus papatasi]|uniref:uncharacterized protein LOC129798260 n=1 Tax=Phlebotomus papatasi TaxID=29031 RepID=UPI0024837E92|nr:uncharacterized protein LOC129798260 [Phlebotomus papatasi]
MARLLGYAPRTPFQIINPRMTTILKNELENTKRREEKKKKGRTMDSQGEKQNMKKGATKNGGKGRSFEKGDPILYFYGSSWIKGVILKKISKVVYLVQLGNKHMKCHRDQLKAYKQKESFVAANGSHKSSIRRSCNAPLSPELDYDSLEDDVFYSPEKLLPVSPSTPFRRSSRLRQKTRVNYKA